MIMKPVSFNAEINCIISTKTSNPGFSHTNWNDEDLLPVRSYIRDHYRVQQEGVCAYCRNPISLSSVGNCHVEHIAPKSLHENFIFEPKNLCVICSDCNTIKRAQEVINDVPDTLRRKTKRYPSASSSFIIVHPHYDDWDQFIIKLGRAYIDKKPKGAITIQICKLNRFFHKFGWEEDFVDDSEINDLMNRYLASKNVVQSAAILNRLREILILI